MSLVEERDSSMDPYFVEDFLLMIILLWVNNHFNDFEYEPKMMKLLEKFENALEDEAMYNHQQLLNIACSVKSRVRTIVYTRSNREEMLHFSILGGYEKGYGIFVAKVEANSPGEKAGLKRGDQVLEVNGNDFRRITRQKALEILRSTTHLSFTVKSNLLGFKEMLSEDHTDLALPLPRGHMSDSSFLYRRGHHYVDGMHRGGDGRRNALVPHEATACYSHSLKSQCSSKLSQADSVSFSGTLKSALETNGKEKSRLARLIKKFRNGSSYGTLNYDADQVECDFQADLIARQMRMTGPLKHSRSNPDITNGGHIFGSISQYYQ
ncbi:unnamed protein product, partial [Soboliphyme baturini]|uniref:PDZ domain-containing protein n=1 Tax=Soboliphyme baturini TaxID=241478 RepID=A0A183JA80_9BILA